MRALHCEIEPTPLSYLMNPCCHLVEVKLQGTRFYYKSECGGWGLGAVGLGGEVGDALLTRILKNSWMEFLFSSFLGTLAASSPAWEAAEAGLSTTASDDLAAALGSSLALAAWAASPAAAGAGVAFLGSAAFKSVAATKNWITLYSLLMKCRWTLRNTSDVKFGISVPAVRIESTLWEVITKEFMFVVMIFKYKNGDQTSAKEVVWEQVLIPDAIDGITPVNNASIYHSSCFPEEPNSTCGGCLDFCCHAV